MGQYEAISSTEMKENLYKDCLLKVENYFNSYHMSYKKFGILIPEFYTNQYEENIKFYKVHPIYGLKSYFKTKSNLNFIISNEIKDILLFFKVD